MKGSIAAASAVFVASAAAAAHNAHGAFHVRRNPAPEVCTVYTTVYVHPSEIPVPVANSTVYVYPTPVESTTAIPCPGCPGEETPAPEPPKEAYPPAEPPKESHPPAEPPKEAYPPAEPPKESYPPTEPPKETYPPAEPPKETPVPSSQPPKVYPPAEPSKEAYVPAPPPHSSKAPQPPRETPAPSTPAYTPVEHKPSSTKAAEKPKPSKPAGGKPYDNSGRIVTNGDKWAMTYTPYTADGQCRSPEQVKEDIKNIAELGFTTIRSYSTDCGVFENVVPECEKYGLKVIYGIFLEGGGKGPGSEYANQQLQDIIDHAGKDSVAMIIVGNEALFNNYCTAEELAAYITYVKEKLVSAGFPEDIAITTTEPVGTWEEKGQALCSVIDVFTVQIHPYFTAKVKAEEAGDFAKQQLEQASKVCPEAAEKGMYITEIGWPKSGNANGEAIPGVQQQKAAMKDILAKVGKESVLFSYQDDHWKEPGEYGVEQSFGCADALY